ncbi:NAD(P)/FAD-dependent oxidoreductase [Aureimonas sp. AU4]|uniref:FAD-dependent oxidoreductase n=1 Tax=Aureimonas sp. AU4 TaxID=1638163 RepID=UPI000AFB0922|nr:FAD-dependent monooxygenase [Aureimonas sp. AU4]
MFDVALVGGGLAGCLSASLLARRGYEVVLIDPNDDVPADFRCEKMEPGHLDRLARLGLAGPLLATATQLDHLWVARFGRLLDVMPFRQCSFRYEGLVTAYRAALPPSVARRAARVVDIAADDRGQSLRLSDGSSLDARLTVLATGLSQPLRTALGARRRVSHRGHSITIGFDMASREPGGFLFPALQNNPERHSVGVGYLSLFRLGSVMRANLFVYHDMRDPLIAAFRAQPAETLARVFPHLRNLTGDVEIVSPVRVRSTDLEDECRPRVPGVVAIGDAFRPACPATGLGTMKVMTDVERLCEVHAPRWLAEGAIPAARVDRFYADPAKAACDRLAWRRGLRMRALATQTRADWAAQRWLRFGKRAGRGWLRRALEPQAARDGLA